MKKFDRVLVTLLVVGIWVLVFTFAFSPNLSKARDPFLDRDPFSYTDPFFDDDDFGSQFEDTYEGYVFKGNVSVRSMPSGKTDRGMIDCKIITR